MFDDLDNKDNQNSANNQENNKASTEDIFSETDNVKKAERPNLPPSLSADQVERMTDEEQQDFSAEKYRPYRKSISKTAKIIRGTLLAILLLAIIGFGSYYVYNMFFVSEEVINETENIVNNENENQDNDINNGEEDININLDDLEQNNNRQDLNDEDGDTEETPEEDAEEDSTEEPDFLTQDLDNDGLTGKEEINIYGTDPNNPDTDGDGYLDGVEVENGYDPLSGPDSDNDGLEDADEINIYGTDPTSIDSDNDGLSDYDEINIHETDPNNPDTDGDGYLDGVEVENGYDPLS
jgi:cell division protein FtsL